MSQPNAETTVSEAEALRREQAAAAAASTTAQTAERSRISAILNHAEAKGRTQLAQSLAFETDMSAEAAGKILAAAGKDAPAPAPAAAAPVSPLAAAMANVPNPPVAAAAPAADADADSPAALAANVMALHRQFKGVKA